LLSIAKLPKNIVIHFLKNNYWSSDNAFALNIVYLHVRSSDIKQVQDTRHIKKNSNYYKMKTTLNNPSERKLNHLRDHILAGIIILCFICISSSLTSCKKVREIIEETEKTYVVISDIHLGDSRSTNLSYGWNIQMRDTLCSFLDYLSTNNDWDELIIAGDLMEEWITPPSFPTFATADGTPVSEVEYFGNIIKNNQAVFDKFQKLKDKGHKIVYIPGNHDMQTTSNDFSKYLPGLFDQARTDNVQGMGEYQPDPEIFIEHGHRYDITNAPYAGKAGIDDIPENSVIPPGFFVSKLSTGAVITSAATKTGGITDADDDNIYDFYWRVIGGLFSKDSVMTMCDEMTKKYGYEDYALSTSKLFNNIDKYLEPKDGWGVRCYRNNAYFIPSITQSILSTFFYDECDKMGINILENTELTSHILVWAHTHSPKLIVSNESQKGKVIYLNTGCWIDTRYAGEGNTSTFGKITKNKIGNYEVSLCRFKVEEGEGEVEEISSETLRHYSIGEE